MDGALFAGFFPQDLIKATAWRHANVQSRHNEPPRLALLIVDRKNIRGFTLHSTWVEIISSHFKVRPSLMFHW